MITAIDTQASKVGSVAGLPILIRIDPTHDAPAALMQAYLNGLRVDGPGGKVTLSTEERIVGGVPVVPEPPPPPPPTPKEAFTFHPSTGVISDYDFIKGGVHVVIPETIDGVPVIEIAAEAFYAEPILSIVAPTSLKTIGGDCFGACISMVTASFPGVETVGIMAFANCYSLVSMSLPVVTTLPNGTFRNCESMTVVDAPQAALIGNNAFEACRALVVLRLNSAATIPMNAFYGCTKLEEVHLREVTSVRDSSFIACSALTKVFYGASDVVIGSYGAPPHNLYPDSPDVTNYVTNPDATGWADTFGGKPVVRLEEAPAEPVTPTPEESTGELIGGELASVVTVVRVAPEAVTGDAAILTVYYSRLKGVP